MQIIGGARPPVPPPLFLRPCNVDSTSNVDSTMVRGSIQRRNILEKPFLKVNPKLALK